MRPLRRLTVRPVLPPPLAALRSLAANLRWAWHDDTQDLFAAIDPDLWDQVGQDPLQLLWQVGPDRLAKLSEDESYLARLAEVESDLHHYLTQPRWYQSLDDAPTRIAYFSPEYGVTEVLPQYSGGLGILAGDHLKAASDIGVPLVAVGLFYRHGYFRQSLSVSNVQQEDYPAQDPRTLPLQAVTDEHGTPLMIQVRYPGTIVHARIWKAQVGRVPLLLLDTDIEENGPQERGITDRLYGGNSEHRLRQEILLGIGGVRALAAFGVVPEVFHTNEGHAGFLGLERIRNLMREQGLDYATAHEAVRLGTVFTTHTPVPAGIDRFPMELVARYLGPEGEDVPHLDRVLALGREPDVGEGVFNMAVMGLRLAQRANGVSCLHGDVARSMFQSLWPQFDGHEVPIGSITNGVHASSWAGRQWRELLIGQAGDNAQADQRRTWEAAAQVSDEALWDARCTGRARLLTDARARLRASGRGRGIPLADLAWIDSAFDPDALTIGFARRVPSYKRLTLILRDRDRLRRLLLDPDRPVQLLVAGKAHPADDGGKQMIREFVEFASDPAVRHRVAFLPDYDMAMARRLVGGADVWLNTPLRPYEACGTSGMKSALNGGLNLSIRDGWWDEWYDGENGWAIPSAESADDPEQRDELEANAIFDLLEQRVVPLFYNRVGTLPRGWLGMMRHTLATLGPKVLASRMVADYTTELYVPSARSSRSGSIDAFRASRELAAWKAQVTTQWHRVSIAHVDVEPTELDFGDELHVRAHVSLGTLRPEDVRVEIAYGVVDNDGKVATPTHASLTPAGSTDDSWSFEGAIRLDRPGTFGYNVRVLPHDPRLTSPAEVGLVTWARPDAS